MTIMNKRKIFISIVCLLCTAALVLTIIGKRHGMDTFVPPIELIDDIKNSPVEDSLPDDTTGCLIILYKFTCPDCKAVYKELSTTLKNESDVYWIASTSDTGKQLVETYKIKEVPTGLYITYNKTNTSAVHYILYDIDSNGNIILDKNNIKRLLQLKHEKR